MRHIKFIFVHCTASNQRWGVKELLEELEIYAKQTNNVTYQHKAEVMTLTSIEEVEAYDITKDYPKN